MASGQCNAKTTSTSSRRPRDGARAPRRRGLTDRELPRDRAGSSALDESFEPGGLGLSGTGEVGAAVTIESTRHEIADVPGLELRGDPDQKLEARVRSRSWTFELPTQFDEESATFAILTRPPDHGASLQPTAPSVWTLQTWSNVEQST
jgi:hypothetical protein